MEREVRYCKSADGTRIAYSVYGNGPTLVECSAWWESFATELPEITEAYRPVRSDRHIVAYDPRGVGLSERNPPTFAHSAMVEDLEAVVRAAGRERISIMASTFGVARAISFAAKHPDAVDRMVLTRCCARMSDAMSRGTLDALVLLIRSNWQAALQLLADQGIRTTAPEFAVRSAAKAKTEITADSAARWLREIYDSSDVIETLNQVGTPTLLIHKVDDRLVPLSCAQDVAAGIPGARLMALEGDGPVSFGGDVAGTMSAIANFLDED